uniref:Variant surface glycoprotein 1125.1089 n=1 Tax=Trypanosoma brucei TaxID=5691 RepID=A0A1J0R697_9TRYP|nr:variant surface glycoprotein 1125.1089 [Trypanosoma brucei]
MRNLSQQKPPTLLLAVTAMVALAPNHIAAAGPAKGENRHAFGLLCDVVMALAKITEVPEASNDAKKAAQSAEHISLILSEYKTITKLTDSVGENAGPRPEDSKLAQACQDQNRQKCDAAAAYLKKLPETEKLKLKHAAEDVHGLKVKLNHTLTQMKAAAKLIIPTDTSKGSKIKGHLTQAIYGEATEPATVTLKGAGSNRETHCGTGGTTAGTSATLSIAATPTCLCASSTGDGASNTACFKDATGNQAFGSTGATITVWDTIKQKCSNKAATTQTKGLPDLGALHTAITGLLYEPKGDGGAIGYIGKVITGDNAGDCNGQDTAGKGACATFTSAANTIEITEWLNKLKQAAAAQAEHTAALRTTALAETHLMALNESLTTLLQLNAKEPGKTEKKPGVAAVEDSKNTEKHAEAEANCNAKDKETECIPPCKWDGEEKDDKKKCTLSEEGEQAAKEGGATTTIGCARHKITEACLADKTDDKKNCSFRKRRGGEHNQHK